jgi:hypothetical protein
MKVEKGLFRELKDEGLRRRTFTINVTMWSMKVRLNPGSRMNTGEVLESGGYLARADGYSVVLAALRKALRSCLRVGTFK